MDVFIRTVNEIDAESIANLSNQLGYKASIEKTTDRLSQIILNQDHCAFVATYNGNIIGWIHGFYTLRIESDPFVEIGGLVIEENHRRMGIGKTLIQKVAEWAMQKNVSTIRVRCNTTRKDAHQFYVGVGFDETKEQKIFTRSLS